MSQGMFSSVKELFHKLIRKVNPLSMEIRLVDGRSRLLRFIDSRFAQHVIEYDHRITIRLADDRGRVSTATCNQLTADALESTLQRARAILEVMPDCKEWPGFPPPPKEPVMLAPASDEETAQSSPAEAASLVARALTRSSSDITFSGSLSISSVYELITNSEGLNISQHRTRVDFRLTARGQTGRTGYAAQSSIALRDLDVESLIDEAVSLAKLQEKQERELSLGNYPVVLAPYAVARLLEILAFYAFSARAIQEGYAPLALGSRLSSVLTVWDDGNSEAGLPIGFDAEGVVKRRVELIRAGELVGIVHDQWTAKRAGTTSTGHALPPGTSDGPLCMNLFMAPGKLSTAELIATIDTGVYINRLHYVNLTDLKNLSLTGVTRDGTYFIKNGKKRYPLRDLRFNQSLLQALREDLQPGAETRLLASDFYGSLRVPALLLPSWHFGA